MKEQEVEKDEIKRYDNAIDLVKAMKSNKVKEGEIVVLDEREQKQEIEEKRFEWKKIVMGIIVLIIVIIVLIEVYNYPKDYSCYQYECTKTNLEDLDRCIDIGYEGCGFLCSNHYYLCDGIKVIKKCLETREINQEIKVNILDIINHRCSSLK